MSPPDELVVILGQHRTMKEEMDDLTVSTLCYGLEQLPDGTRITTRWKGLFTRSVWRTTPLFSQHP